MIDPVASESVAPFALSALRSYSEPLPNRDEIDPPALASEGDVLVVSPEAREMLLRMNAIEDEAVLGTLRPENEESDDEAAAEFTPALVEDTETDDPLELSDGEKHEVDELAVRDREVRTHEQAHAAAAGAHTIGGPVYEYEVGPDGRRYAVGGSVQMDLSSERTPRETIAKMQQIKKAAMASSSPSGADRAVAAKASQKEARARQQLTDEQAAKSREVANRAS